jgi:hypothetical protein
MKTSIMIITFKCFIYLIETKIQHASYVNKFINLLKYSYISIHDDHGLMMINDIHIDLKNFNTITNDGSKYITTTFNIYTQK